MKLRYAHTLNTQTHIQMKACLAYEKDNNNYYAVEEEQVEESNRWQDDSEVAS